MTATPFKTFEAAAEYAKGLREDLDILLSPSKEYFNVIRPYGTGHYRQHGFTVAGNVRVEMKVYKLEPIKEPGPLSGEDSFMSFIGLSMSQSINAVN